LLLQFFLSIRHFPPENDFAIYLRRMQEHMIGLEALQREQSLSKPRLNMQVSRVGEIRKELEEHYDGEIRVLSTSVAGEHLVKYSPPCSDGTSCPGRSGAGAVMGSKNLKAIAVRGNGEISLYDPSGLLEQAGGHGHHHG
jgi:hypothetical protein